MSAKIIDGKAIARKLRAEYRARALDTVGYVQRTLADAARGGFFASQRADEDYYAVTGRLASLW